jgi:glycopeptide antibiotics resistance protein
MRGTRLRAWFYVSLMLGLILITLPLTPILWRAGTKGLGRRLDLLGYVALIVAILFVLMYMIRHRARFCGFHFLLIAALAGIYFYLLKHQCRFPAEKLHLLEYGVVACLFYRALRTDFPSAKSYVLAFLMSSGFGFLDEIIQYLLPNRVFEIRDVMTNVAASALGLVVLALLITADRHETPVHGGGV